METRELEKKIKKEISFFRIAVVLVLIVITFFLFVLWLAYKETASLSQEQIPVFQKETEDYTPATQHEETIINVVRNVSPAVVSVVVTKDIPIIERRLDVFEDPFGFKFQIPQYEEKGTEKKEIGGGSGFIVSANGMVLTNRHVVQEVDAQYTIFTNDGQSFTAEVIARDPVQDLALMQIKENKTFPTVKLGDSNKAVIGQTAIAIGNALGEFKNTVSVGVVSGLDRTVSIAEAGRVYTFEKVIQTDAAINKGNSGGPLLNLKGEVIGINTAMAIGAQNIGFSVPINKAQRMIQSVLDHGEIVYPFLGVRYLTVDSSVSEEYGLTVDYGAWVVKGGNNEPAIDPSSAADKAGLKENDIILEFDGKKITKDNSLAQIILDYHPGDRVSLKVLRDSKEISIEAVLGKMNN
jgi:serine protease Do